MPNSRSTFSASSMTGRSLSLPMATHTLCRDPPAASGALLLRGLTTESSLLKAWGRDSSRGRRSGGRVREARPERLRALAAIEHTIAGETVAVTCEELGHLLLPRVDEPHLLVVRHGAHLEEQADVLARLVVDAEELEDRSLAGGVDHVPLPWMGTPVMLARRARCLNAPRGTLRSRRSARESRGAPGLARGYFQGVPRDVRTEVTSLEANCLGGGVAALARLREGGAEGGDGQDTAGGGDELPFLHGRAGVEHFHAVQGGGAVGAGDRATGLGLLGVATRGQDHADRARLKPFDRDLLQTPCERGLQHGHQVALHPNGDQLGFGVAEACVVLQDARSLLRQHQPHVQDAPVRPTFLGQPGDRRHQDPVHDLMERVGVDVHRRRVAPHAAGVRAGVAVLEPLVVLAGDQRKDALAVRKGEERGLVSFQELFHDHAIARHSETALHLKDFDRLLRLLPVPRQDDAFASSQPVRLEDDREAVLPFLEGGPGLPGGPADLEARGRDLVFFHELLREDLARLDFGGRLRGAENRQVALLEFVDDPEGERQLRPDDRQIDLDGRGEVRQFDDGRGVDRDAVGDLRHPDVARGAIQFLDERTASEFPAEGVLPGAISDDENLHFGMGPEGRRPRTSGLAPRRLNDAAAHYSTAFSTPSTRTDVPAFGAAARVPV